MGGGCSMYTFLQPDDAQPMPEIDVDGTRIPYQVRRSGRARRLRIVVTPGKVEAVAPVRLAEREIHAFVAAKRRWVLRKTEELARRASNMTPERWVSGAKVPFRGRHLPLRIEAAPVAAAELTAPGGGRESFHLRVPAAINGYLRAASAREVLIQALQKLRHDTVGLLQNGQQDMLGIDLIMPITLQNLVGSGRSILRSLGKAFKPHHSGMSSLIMMPG